LRRGSNKVPDTSLFKKFIRTGGMAYAGKGTEFISSVPVPPKQKELVRIRVEIQKGPRGVSPSKISVCLSLQKKNTYREERTMIAGLHRYQGNS